MGLVTPNNYHRKKVRDMVYPSSGGDFYWSSVGGTPIAYVNADNALKNTNVFAVINRIASDVASAHFKTENHAALNRLESPSRLISRFSFWQSILIQLCLSGNAYVPLIGGNLEHLPPADVQLDYLPGNTGIVYSVMENNERPKLTLRDDQMLHFRLMPDPDYRFLIGRSPLDSLGDALTVAKKTMDSNLKSLNNQINAAGKLKITGMLNDDLDPSDARNAFEEANAGDNAGRLMVLPDGFDYSEFQMKADVFKALNENASFSADQISKAFGVPSDMLGGGTSTESQHSNSDQIKALYLSNLNTYVHPILDELKLKLHAPDLDLDIKDMLDVDDSTMIGQINDLVTSKALSPNQAQWMLQRSGFLPNGLPEYDANWEGGTKNGN
ncbi:phage portal protein [Furfurilactobacillus sp. WILCCON 0119]|uniref:phage portal protein n=1 Tax=Furfurilactobacillus entadae TaxID=2922307 RepID=UPI0035EC06C1